MSIEKEISKNWQSKENKALLKKLIEKFGNYKYIQIVDWNGGVKYFKVTTKRIITKGIKAQDLLARKYGQEISKETYHSKTK